MKLWTPEQYGKYSWSVLPHYGDAASLREAIETGTGTCMHRSAVIGRKALELDQPSFRVIIFAKDKPCSFYNLIGIGGNDFMTVSTGHTRNQIYVPRQGPSQYTPGTIHLGSIRTGLTELQPLEEVSPPDAIAIPEELIPAFKGCLAPADYASRAQGLQPSGIGASSGSEPVDK